MRPKDSPTENTLKTDARTRALHTLSRMRRQHLSLAEACRLEHIKPSTFLRNVGGAVRQDRPGGRYRAIAGDRFRRDLQIPTALGPTAVPIYGSKNAREISNYLNAIALYLRKGDASRLERFKGKTVSVRGQKVELITDPATLSSLALAGALQFDQLYASFTGGA
ncbi:MAG: hypothetical protein WAK70_15755 [Candidatus Sulfotelmatobacter sp.]